MVSYIKTVSLSGGAMEAGVIGKNLMTQSLIEMQTAEEKRTALEAQNTANTALATATEDSLHHQAQSQRDNGIGSITNGATGLGGEAISMGYESFANRKSALKPLEDTQTCVKGWEEGVKDIKPAKAFVEVVDPRAPVKVEPSLSESIERIKRIDVAKVGITEADKDAIAIVKRAKDPTNTEKDCLDDLDKKISSGIEKAEGAISNHYRKSENRADRLRRTAGFMGLLGQGSAQMAASLETNASADAERRKVGFTYIKDAMTAAVSSGDKAMDTASQAKQASIQADAAIIQANNM